VVAPRNPSAVFSPPTEISTESPRRAPVRSDPQSTAGRPCRWCCQATLPALGDRLRRGPRTSFDFNLVAEDRRQLDRHHDHGYPAVLCDLISRAHAAGFPLLISVGGEEHRRRGFAARPPRRTCSRLHFEHRRFMVSRGYDGIRPRLGGSRGVRLRTSSPAAGERITFRPLNAIHAAAACCGRNRHQPAWWASLQTNSIRST